MNIGGAGSYRSAYFPQAARLSFDGADTDKNGSLSLDEFSAARKNVPSGKNSLDDNAIQALFSAIDTDSSGQISKTEAKSAFDKISQALQSQLLSAQEQFGAGPPSPQPTEATATQAASDAGGSPSLDALIAEVASQTNASSASTIADRFQALDTGAGAVAQSGPAAAFAATAAPAGSNVVVSNASELLSAVANRSSDTVIVLKAGDYGSVSINGNGSSLPITLQAEDPSHSPVFRFLTINNASNVSLNGLTFTPPPSGGVFTGASLTIANSQNVTVEASTFAGGPTAFADSVYGMSVTGSSNVAVADSTFVGVRKGGIFLNDNGVTLTGNTLTNLREDGFDLIAASNVEIAHNQFSDFHPAADDHPDAIQFMTLGTSTPSANINIHDNVMSFTTAAPGQGIFMGNEANIPYQNVVIANNTIYTGVPQGISVATASGVQISNNIAVATDSSSAYKVQINVSNASNVVVSSNVADAIGVSTITNGSVTSNTTNYLALASNTNVSSSGNTEVTGTIFTQSNLPRGTTTGAGTSTGTTGTGTTGTSTTGTSTTGTGTGTTSTGTGTSTDTTTGGTTTTTGTSNPPAPPPPVSTGAAPAIAGASQDTLIAGDGITSARALTLTGTAPAGSIVKVFDGSTQIGAATADVSGAWSFVTPTLLQGAHGFTATANGATSAEFKMTVDTTAPTAPTVVATSSGSKIAGDGSTNASQLTIGGTGEANSWIKIFDGANQIGSTTTDASGAWSFTTATLADGDHSFSAIAMDRAGNTGAASAGLAIRVDTQAPAAPSIVDAATAGDHQVQLTGTAAANSTVKIFDGTTGLGTATADGSGAWSYLAKSLTDGAHAFTATATDTAGNTSAASAAFSATVALPDPVDPAIPAPPSAPVIESFSRDTLIAGDGITSAKILTLNGTADANTALKLFDGATQVGTVTTDSNGKWTFTTPTLTDGTHAFTAKKVDAAGAIGDASAVLKVTVDTTGPNAPVITSFSPDSDVVGDGITSANRVTLTGTAEANGWVKVFDGNTQIGSAVTDASGAWSFLTAALTDGTHKFTTVGMDAAGNTSAPSSVLLVTVQASAGAPTSGAMWASQLAMAASTYQAQSGSTDTVQQLLDVLQTA